jgi:hypothetical protein
MAAVFKMAFYPIFSKMINSQFFLIFSLLWVKIKLLWKNYFLNIQKGGKTPKKRIFSEKCVAISTQN